MDLPKVRQARMAPGEIAVADVRARVGVAFDAVAFHQDYAVPSWFAEVVSAIGGDRHHPPLQQKIVRLQHQAARASERRF